MRTESSSEALDQGNSMNGFGEAYPFLSEP